MIENIKQIYTNSLILLKDSGAITQEDVKTLSGALISMIREKDVKLKKSPEIERIGANSPKIKTFYEGVDLE